MSVRRAALLATFLVTVVALLGSAAPALATTIVPPALAPDEAQTLATTGTETSGSTTSAGTLCGVSWRAGQVIAGGVGRGFTYFTNRASAGFGCPTTIPWFTIHTTHHEDVKRTDRGVTTLVGAG